MKPNEIINKIKVKGYGKEYHRLDPIDYSIDYQESVAPMYLKTERCFRMELALYAQWVADDADDEVMQSFRERSAHMISIALYGEIEKHLYKVASLISRGETTESLDIVLNVLQSMRGEEHNG